MHSTTQTIRKHCRYYGQTNQQVMEACYGQDSDLSWSYIHRLEVDNDNYVHMLAQLAPCTARSQSCCQTPCCPTVSGTGLTNQRIPVFYKFWPLKLSMNLGPFGKSVIQLYVYAGYAPFYAQLYLYCTFSHVVILFFIWLFGHFGRKVDR